MNQPIPYASSEYAQALPDKVDIELDAEAGLPRLNVFVPHLYRSFEFGGLSSVFELSRYLSAFYNEIRFVSAAGLPPADDLIDITPYAAGESKRTAQAVSTEDATLSFHARDIFLCSYWPSVPVWERHADLMREAGLKPNPFYYFIQDWEPGFYPLGAKHMQADATYRHGDNCVAIFNSKELAKYFHLNKYEFKERFAIRPSLNRFLDKVLSEVRYTVPPKGLEKINVLVYGRPEQPRNCFNALLGGVAEYADRFFPNEEANIRFVSAGIPHEDIEFDNGLILESLGKLSINDYAQVLVHSHAGVSLMASPHPSYPPLEMACFGLEVVTNSFQGKNLSRHPRIHSIDIPEPGAIGHALNGAIAAAKARAGEPTPVVLPDSLSEKPWRETFQSARLPRIEPTT